MPYILKKYYPVRNILFFFGEGFLIFLTIMLVYLTFSGWAIFCIDFLTNALRAGVVTVVFQLTLYFFDLYDLSRTTKMVDTAVRIVQSFGVGCIVLAGLYTSFPRLVISTKIFWIGYLVICLALTAWRALYYALLEKRLFSQPILLLGTGKIAKEIAEEIENKQDAGYKIAAFVGKELPLHNPHNAPLISPAIPLPDTCVQYHPERIVVALDDRRGAMPIQELLTCKIRGVEIEDGITFYEAITGKILVENVNPAWLVFSEGFNSGRFAYLIKRIADILLAVFGLLISLPVTLITATLIKLESSGPVFYSQERVGERGDTFKVVKFRSMGQDAEKNGAVWAMKNDNRVTRVGGFIRKARIDEIPQMWNVLKGEMSFVGPRPERQVFVEKLIKTIPYYSLRHSVKPGITGWAQVCYPYGASEEDALRKLEYDLYYIKNQSIFIDFLVIFRTVKTVLAQKGSR